MRALYLPAGHGTPSLITIPDKDGAYAEAISCKWIERVRTPIENVALVVDEEGLYTDKPTNHLASLNLYPGRIVGDALVLSEAWGVDGLDFTSLTDEHLWLVAGLLCIKPVVAS